MLVYHKRIMRLLRRDPIQLFNAISRQASKLRNVSNTKDNCETVVGMNAAVKRERLTTMRPR